MTTNEKSLHYSAKSITSFGPTDGDVPTDWDFLMNFAKFVPEIGTTSPLLRRNPYKANKVARLLFRNPLEKNDMKWKLRQVDSPNCDCKSSEENVYFFLRLHELRPCKAIATTATRFRVVSGLSATHHPHH